MTKAGFSDFDVQYFPRWREQVTEYGVGGFVIMKSTKYPQEAWQWAQFFTSSADVAAARVKSGWDLPALSNKSYVADYLKQTPPANRQGHRAAARTPFSKG